MALWQVSALGHSMLAVSGGNILMTGIHLLALARGLSQSQSFAAAFVANALLAIRWALTDANALGAPILGPLGWAAISAVLAGFALKG